jgi:hypothetical protein
VPPTRQQKVLAFASLLGAAAIGAAAAVALTSGGSASPRAQGSPSPAPPASAAPSPTPSPSPSPSPTLPPLDVQALRSAPVPALCGHPAGTLVNGHLPGTPAGEAGVELRQTAFGDLNADGVAEGVAVLSCAQGNTVVRTVHVYRNPLAYVGAVDAGATLKRPIAITGVRVASGMVEVSARYPGEDDPRCCPTGYVVQRFRLDGSTAKLQPPVGVSPAARLTGDGWGTIRAGATYAELARATGLPVTISSLDDPNVDTAPCTYVHLSDGEADFAIMGGEGKVRAVVFSKPGVLSKSGVGVGSTEQQVLAVYGSRATRARNEYTDIQDVIVQAGPGRVVRFEFDDQHRVGQMHGGEASHALLIEGCA